MTRRFVIYDKANRAVFGKFGSTWGISYWFWLRRAEADVVVQSFDTRESAECVRDLLSETDLSVCVVDVEEDHLVHIEDCLGAGLLPWSLEFWYTLRAESRPLRAAVAAAR